MDFVVFLISRLDEINFEGVDELERFLCCAAVYLARALLSGDARTRGPPAIPLSGGRPSRIRRPPPPLFSVTVPLSERRHGPSQYYKKSITRTLSSNTSNDG